MRSISQQNQIRLNLVWGSSDHITLHAIFYRPVTDGLGCDFIDRGPCSVDTATVASRLMSENAHRDSSLYSIYPPRETHAIKVKSRSIAQRISHDYGQKAGIQSWQAVKELSINKGRKNRSCVRPSPGKEAGRGERQEEVATPCECPHAARRAELELHSRAVLFGRINGDCGALRVCRYVACRRRTSCLDIFHEATCTLSAPGALLPAATPRPNLKRQHNRMAPSG